MTIGACTEGGGQGCGGWGLRAPSALTALPCGTAAVLRTCRPAITPAAQVVCKTHRWGGSSFTALDRELQGTRRASTLRACTAAAARRARGQLPQQPQGRAIGGAPRRELRVARGLAQALTRCSCKWPTVSADARSGARGAAERDVRSIAPRPVLYPVEGVST